MHKAHEGDVHTKHRVAAAVLGVIKEEVMGDLLLVIWRIFLGSEAVLVSPSSLLHVE